MDGPRLSGTYPQVTARRAPDSRSIAPDGCLPAAFYGQVVAYGPTRLWARLPLVGDLLSLVMPSQEMRVLWTGPEHVVPGDFHLLSIERQSEVYLELTERAMKEAQIMCERMPGVKKSNVI